MLCIYFSVGAYQDGVVQRSHHGRDHARAVFPHAEIAVSLKRCRQIPTGIMAEYYLDNINMFPLLQFLEAKPWNAIEGTKP